MICLKANSKFCCLYTENWIWLSSYHHLSFISWRKAALFWVLPETHHDVAMSSALRLKQRNCNKYQSANMSGRRHEPEMAFILAKPQGEWIFKFTSEHAEQLWLCKVVAGPSCLHSRSQLLKSFSVQGSHGRKWGNLIPQLQPFAIMHTCVHVSNYQLCVYEGTRMEAHGPCQYNQMQYVQNKL